MDSFVSLTSVSLRGFRLGLCGKCEIEILIVVIYYFPILCINMLIFLRILVNQLILHTYNQGCVR
jgi:hypothetical protein